MNFADFNISWRGSQCPYLVIEASPGLPHGLSERALQGIPKPCDMTIAILDEHRLANKFLVPLPFQLPSDGSWWVDMPRISLVMARIVQVALQTRPWQGHLLTGICSDGPVPFRDDRGRHWAATTEPVPWEWGTLLALKECCATEEDWRERLVDMLSAPNNILLPLSDPPILPPGLRDERPTCFHGLLGHSR